MISERVGHCPAEWPHQTQAESVNSTNQRRNVPITHWLRRAVFGEGNSDACHPRAALVHVLPDRCRAERLRAERCRWLSRSAGGGAGHVPRTSPLAMASCDLAIAKFVRTLATASRHRRGGRAHCFADVRQTGRVAQPARLGAAGTGCLSLRAQDVCNVRTLSVRHPVACATQLCRLGHPPIGNVTFGSVCMESVCVKTAHLLPGAITIGDRIIESPPIRTGSPRPRPPRLQERTP